MSCFMPPPCSFCKHYLGEDESQDRECRAFKEIPDDIITGDCDHTTPYPNDSNILFELREEVREDFEEVKLMKNELLLFTIDKKSQLHLSSG